MTNRDTQRTTGTPTGEPKHTTQLPTFGTVQVAGPELAGPEFVDHHGATAMFCLSRPYLYRLASEGHIRTVLLRQPGKLKGRRLFECASLRAFLLANIATVANA